MPADPAILRRIRGCPFARGGRVLVRFRANGYSLFARRSGEPLARLRLTGNGDEVVLLSPRTAVAGARSATSASAPCRSTKRSNASATIHISWNSGRPTSELPQLIDTYTERRSLETTEGKYTPALSKLGRRPQPACVQGERFTPSTALSLKRMGAVPAMTMKRQSCVANSLTLRR